MPRNASLSDNYVSDRFSFFRLAISANIWFTAARVPNLRSWLIYIPSFIYGKNGLELNTLQKTVRLHAKISGEGIL